MKAIIINEKELDYRVDAMLQDLELAALKENRTTENVLSFQRVNYVVRVLIAELKESSL